MKATKVCNTCGKRKKISEYHIHKTSSDGLRHYCKSCGSFKVNHYRKTKSTKTEVYESVSKKRLDGIVGDLNIRYKKLGYMLVLEKLKDTE